MGAWGLKNGHQEPWDFGHPGWLNERLAAHIVSPVKDALVVEALALDARHQRPDTRRRCASHAAGAARRRTS